MTKEQSAKAACNNPEAIAWVETMAALCQPNKIQWCDGSEPEHQALLNQAHRDGIISPLNPDILPGCWYHHSDPDDVARVEGRTFICSPAEGDAGPTNNWADPAEMYQKLHHLADGAMRGRTMYVVPYLMGHSGGKRTKVGLEITDSIYVVLSMRVMTRMGAVALTHLGSSGSFTKGLHCMLDLNKENRYIAHFPHDNAIISMSSNYGGNVLQGKKCLALRLGSALGQKEGWMAEHMLLMKVENPQGEATYVAAAFPSACGKTNFAMLIPPAGYDGWKITTVGDDIAWLWPGDDGRLWAMNPENGYFGVAPGTNSESNPNAMVTISSTTIYTNVARTHDQDVWWEGKTPQPPPDVTDWRGRPWTSKSLEKAAHPNSRFAAPMENNPALAKEALDPAGVPISAIVFGGRRATTYPLVFQAFNWSHGTYLGSMLGSETTAAAAGTIGTVRRDPMAMLPFCGYHMGDYFAHWLNIGKHLAHPPRIFHVNWFRKGADGSFLWPGFSDNMRVLEWIVNRCHGHAEGDETHIGWMPFSDHLNIDGMDGYTRADLDRAQAIIPKEWMQELDNQQTFFDRIGERMPKELGFERELLRSRLS